MQQSNTPPPGVSWDVIRSGVNTVVQQVFNYLYTTRGLVVQSGPFAGMRYVGGSVGSGFVPKLLGSYEANLHPLIEDIIVRAPAQIVNIGSGEGYYAVGLATRLPTARVYAFETDVQGQQLCKMLAEQNQVADRVTVAGECKIDDLRRLATARPFILCDCEGGELQLLNPELAPELRDCEILVELHDFMNRTITPTIVSRFSATHDVNIMLDTGRNVHAYPALHRLSELYQLLAVFEGRPESMYWGHLRPKRAAVSST